MLVKTYSAAVNGLDVTPVTIEVSLTRGVMYHLTGLGDEAVREGRDRIAAAMQYNGLKFPKAGRKQCRPAVGYRHSRRRRPDKLTGSWPLYDGRRIGA